MSQEQIPLRKWVLLVESETHAVTYQDACINLATTLIGAGVGGVMAYFAALRLYRRQLAENRIQRELDDLVELITKSDLAAKHEAYRQTYVPEIAVLVSRLTPGGHKDRIMGAARSHDWLTVAAIAHNYRNSILGSLKRPEEGTVPPTPMPRHED